MKEIRGIVTSKRLDSDNSTMSKLEPKVSMIRKGDYWDGYIEVNEDLELGSEIVLAAIPIKK